MNNNVDFKSILTLKNTLAEGGLRTKNQFNKEKKAEIVTNIRGSIIQAKGLRKFRFYMGLVSSSLLVLVRIHFQAFFLWLKRFKIFPHGRNGYAD